MTDDPAIAELAKLIEHDLQYPRESAAEIARRIHAAGWRRPGPITDSQVEAGAAIIDARKYDQWTVDSTANIARAVLEAAAVPAAPEWRATPVAEWKIKVDDPVLIYVVHTNAEFEKDEKRRKEMWEGWYVGRWIDHNHGGWMWHGMLGTVTHVAPLLIPPPPVSP